MAYEIRGEDPPLVAAAWWVSHLELDWQSAGYRRFWGPTLELMRHCGFSVAADEAVWRGMPAIVHPLIVGRATLD